MCFSNYWSNALRCTLVRRRLEVKIINGSFKIGRIAGILSVANIMLLISIKIIARCKQAFILIINAAILDSHQIINCYI